MANVDLMAPNISKIIKGIGGKVILIYGPNKCGKTYNVVQAPKPLVLAFEQGLGAINGVPYFFINTWSDFRSIVKQLSDKKNFETLHEKYNTIIVDAIDGIEKLSDRYVCGMLGINTIKEYNSGYGAWKEWGDEIDSQLRLLCSSGFTIIFIGHEGSRKFTTPDGQDYEMVYPRGNNRVIDPILNYVDITGYVRLADCKDDGTQRLSTLYLLGNRTFFAGGRFMGIRPSIPEWNYKAFEKAIVDVIDKNEKSAGGGAITNEEAMAIAEANKAVSVSDPIPLSALIKHIGEMARQSANATGGRNEYTDIVAGVTGNPGFKCSAATEEHRKQLEAIKSALIEKGYTYSE